VDLTTFYFSNYSKLKEPKVMNTKKVKVGEKE